MEMPAIWSLPLTGGHSVDRRGVHALLSEWLDTDHHASSKPWSWSASGGELRVGVFDDRLSERLHERFDVYRRSRTGRAGVELAGSLRQVAGAPWDALRSATAHREWRVDFTTAVTFRRGRRFVPWPSPSAVFGSLRATWRTFAAPHVGDLELDLALDPLVVTSVRGATVVEQVALRDHRTPGRAVTRLPVSGFIGAVGYAIDGAVDPSAVGALARLAPFCGVGAYTTRGFGAVRVTAAS